MYSNLESDERKRDEVVSCLYWSLMQNWNIPRSIQDCYGFTEDYRLFHRLEEMSPDEYRQKRLTGEVPDSLEVDARLTHRAEALFEIRKRGGLTSDSPVNTMNYLVLGSQEWSEMNGGIASRKVQKAAELQKKGKPVQIISEEEFYSMLDATV